MAIANGVDIGEIIKNGGYTELETGREVRMRVVELSRLYLKDKIPNELLPLAAKELFPDEADKAERGKAFKDRFRLACWVVECALLEPRVVETPTGPGEITIDELFIDEIWEVYELANFPARALRNFRRQQRVGVEPVSVLQDVEQQAEP